MKTQHTVDLLAAASECARTMAARVSALGPPSRGDIYCALETAFIRGATAGMDNARAVFMRDIDEKE